MSESGQRFETPEIIAFNTLPGRDEFIESENRLTFVRAVPNKVARHYMERAVCCYLDANPRTASVSRETLRRGSVYDLYYFYEKVSAWTYDYGGDDLG